MRIETFAMERMQSTYEFAVDYDMSASGIRPVSINDLVGMGLDLGDLLDMPLGYSQSNGTPELKALLAQHYPGATPDNIEVTNGTSEANYLVALSQIEAGDEFALEIPNYMQLDGVPKSLGATLNTFSLRSEAGWQVDWDAFERAVTPRTRLVYVSHPNNPSGAVLDRDSMQRIVARCEKVGAYLIADEVYIGAEHDGARTPSFWGMSDRVIVTSGLSKAYGIPGIRIGWIVGPPDVVHACWSQHDYITIGPNKLSDRMAQIAVRPQNRQHLYERTRAILRANLPFFRRWVEDVPQLHYTPSRAGAYAFLKLKLAAASEDIARGCLDRQNTLVVPGVHFGMEGYLRLWLGGSQDYLGEGFRRIAAELEQWT